MAGLAPPPCTWSRHPIARDDIELTIPRQLRVQVGLRYGFEGRLSQMSDPNWHAGRKDRVLNLPSSKYSR
jgi:hypothetical protein